MSIQVSTFNDTELKKAIKESSPLIQEYISALKNVIWMQEETITIAKQKIFDMAEEKK